MRLGVSSPECGVAALPLSRRRYQRWLDTQQASGRSVSATFTESGVVQWLNGDHQVLLADGSYVTVDAILADAGRYHEAGCRDPLEPDYDGGRVVGRIYTLERSGYPTINSFAHGGIVYKLRASAAADFGPDAPSPESDETEAVAVDPHDDHRTDMGNSGRFAREYR